MAKGGCAVSGADICLSVTGIAGPDGGTEKTPVGTVFMGCCYNSKVIVREFHFTGNRAKIREQAVAHGLAFLRECVMEGVTKKRDLNKYIKKRGLPSLREPLFLDYRESLSANHFHKAYHPVEPFCFFS